MKAGVILNGISLKKKRFYTKILPVLEQNLSIDVFETRTKNHAIELGAKALSGKYDVLIAAGGDGTVHQVINGMLREQPDASRLPVFAVIPIGGGNDFARAIGATENVNMLIEKLKTFETRTIDVGELTCRKESKGREVFTRYFVNVVDTGMGPEVVDQVMKSGRAFGSAVAYYQAILSTFLSYRPVQFSAVAAEFTWTDRMRTFAIANGNYFGSGLCIAPDAKQDDGIFDIFACGPVSVLDFILQSIPLKQGKRITHSLVRYFKCREVHLTAENEVKIEADGEFCGWLPASVRMSPVKLRILRMDGFGKR